MSGVLFDHIAIAVGRLAEVPPFLVGELGGVPDFGMPTGAYRFGQWRFAGGGRLEILEPMGDDGFLHRFLKQRGPGIHHVTFKVPSLAEACERARARGYVIIGYDDADPHWKEAFLHPKEALGIVVQLAEEHPRPGWKPRWEPPPGPPDPPPPVTVLGLRMRAGAANRAERQWGEVLRGQRVEGPGGTLIYRWPGSPMRLLVEINPEGEEGPVAVEVSSPRALALPVGPHPVFGAVFSGS